MSALVRIRAPYTPAIVRVGRARVGAPSSGCGCIGDEQSVEVFNALDMPHAAGMHAAGEGRAPWPASDWIMHLDEEEAPGKFFDASRAIAAKLPAHSGEYLNAEIDRLLAEHAEVRKGLARGEIPDDSVAIPHGDREDAIIRRYFSQFMAYAAWRKRTKVGFDLGAASDAVRSPMEPVGLTVEPSIMPHATAPSVDKFMDPRAQFYDPSCNRVAQPAYLLGVPPVASKRIARMRSKVEAAKSAGVLGRGVEPVAESSHDAISVEGKLLALKYEALAQGELAEKEIADFADRIGQKVEDLIRQTTPQFMEDLAKANLKEFGLSAWKVLGPQIMHEVRSISDGVGSLAGSVGSSSAAFTDLVKAIPMLGTMVSWYIGAVDQWSREEDERWASFCAEFIQTNIVDVFQRTLRLGYPYPWHIFDLDLSCPTRDKPWDPTKPVGKWDTTPAQMNAAVAMKTNLRWCIDLERNLLAAASVTRWWTLAMQLMTFGDMRWVFQAMMADQLPSPCNDGTMSTAYTCGWQVASDEQVLLVAYPIAASNGLDPWIFAEELYKRSHGWADPAVESLLVLEPIKRWEYDDDGDIVSLPSACGTYPVNAMHVQWAVLARDAFALAESAVRGEVPSLAPGADVFLGMADESGTGTGGSSRPWWVVGLGGLASAALYLGGASTGVMLAPLGASVLYAATR